MKRIQAFVDIAVNIQFHNVKFENRVKNKKPFFIKQVISLFLKNKYMYFFILGNVLFLRFLRIQLPEHFFC